MAKNWSNNLAIWSHCFFKKMAQPRPIFLYFLFFSNTNSTEKTVGFSGIRTQFVRVEGKHADHLTITRAQSDLTGFLRGFGNFVKTLEQLLQQFLLTNFASEESWQCWRQKSSKNCKNCCHFLLGVQCRLREQYYKRFSVTNIAVTILLTLQGRYLCTADLLFYWFQIDYVNK